MKQVFAFDFDGTLTTRDTLIAFIRDACGTPRFLFGFLLHAPLLVLMKLKLYSNGKTKQRIFSWFFKGMPLETFDALCQDFAHAHRHLLRSDTVRLLEQALAEGSEVLIVSASIDNWVQPFFPSVTVLGTQIEVIGGRLTGRFLTPNCYGQAKVRRILALHPDRYSYHLTAYGDSRGDRELLAFADEAHMVRNL
ncbi:MAG: HAD-IB family phosphatase [Prevotella sp.]|nr:HAD-IB family phosphatase [Prevotella sp.]